MGPLSAEEAPASAPALLEAIDRDGLVRQTWRVEHWPLTIGRGLDNDIVLSDPHLAAHHATLNASATAPREVQVDVGSTLNGISVAGKTLRAGESHRYALAGSDFELQLGRSALRLRFADAALPPEQPLSAAREPRWGPTAVVAAAVVAVTLFEAWLQADPEGSAGAAGNAVLTVLIGGAVWCGLWALLSKTFVRRGHVAWHVRVFSIGSAALLAVGAAAPALAFAFSWPWVSDFSFLVVYATLAGVFYFHLLAVEPARQRLLRGIVAAGFVAAAGVAIWFNVQRTSRPGEELYMNHLLPPQLRAARPIGVDAFVAGLAPMQAILDRQAKRKDDGSADDGGGAGEEE